MSLKLDGCSGPFSFTLAGLAEPSVGFDSVAVVPSHLSHWLGLFWGLALPFPRLIFPSAQSGNEAGLRGHSRANELT